MRTSLTISKVAKVTLTYQVAEVQDALKEEKDNVKDEEEKMMAYEDSLVVVTNKFKYFIDGSIQATLESFENIVNQVEVLYPGI